MDAQKEVDLMCGHKEAERALAAGKNKLDEKLEVSAALPKAKSVVTKKRKFRAIVDEADYELRMVDGAPQYVFKGSLDGEPLAPTMAVQKDAPSKTPVETPIETAKELPRKSLKLVFVRKPGENPIETPKEPPRKPLKLKFVRKPVEKPVETPKSMAKEPLGKKLKLKIRRVRFSDASNDVPGFSASPSTATESEPQTPMSVHEDADAVGVVGEETNSVKDDGYRRSGRARAAPARLQ